MITRTARYSEPWGRWALLAPLLVVLMYVTTPEQRIWQGRLEGREGADFVSSPSFTLPMGWRPGLRIEGEAWVPINKWAALQLRLVDDEGNVLVDLVKEAWNERGTWIDGSETGRYHETDTHLSWSARLQRNESVHLELAVLDMGYNVSEANTMLDVAVHDPAAPFPVYLKVWSRSGDTGLFWLAFLVSGGLALVAYYRAGHSGEPVIVERELHSQVEGTAELGGAGRLVTVAVSGDAGTRTDGVTVGLVLRDGEGRLVHEGRVHVETWQFKHEGPRHFWAHFHLELAVRQRYKVFASIGLGGHSMKLVVRDGNTTRGPVEVTVVPAGGAA